MPAPPVESAPASETEGLSRIFVLIVLTEVVVIAALYWFGVHFS